MQREIHSDETGADRLRMRAILQTSPVIPVVTLPDADRAVPLARALAAGGLPVVEVTLRTDAALEAIRRIAGEVSEAVVGAGTVSEPGDLEAVRRAGARFAVSPGLTPDLIRASRDGGLPLLPGVMTPSEAMTARDLGFTELKFFPAEPAGGMALLKAFSGPMPDLLFCPTGGISADLLGGYLSLPNVACVGGSWVAPKDAVAEGDWPRITRLAAEACQNAP